MRTHPARTPFHALRAGMVATVALTLAACAHVLAGGQLPGPMILLALLALTGLACTAVTRLKLGFPAVAGLLGAGQLVLHEAFTALGGTVAGPAGNAAAPHHGPALLPTSLPASPLEQVQAHGLDSPLALLMLAGHAAATLACALILARGEDALWGLAAWLRPLIELPSPVSPDAAAAPAVAVPPVPAAPLPWRNQRPDCRRGPPAAVVFS